MKELFCNIRSFIKTTLFFTIAISSLPFLIVSFLCVQIGHNILLVFLKLRYSSKYDFSKAKKLRSLIDTTRNVAVFHFLLQINGRCNFDEIRENFKLNVIEKSDKDNRRLYTKLRRQLVSCWGYYAWVKDDSEFDLNDHVIQSSAAYRGRPVTDNNLQDFVSELVTKYLPTDKPPWQIIIIPMNSGSSPESDDSISNEHFYILVRFHHLLMAEEKHFQLNEMLMLNSYKTIKLYDQTIECPQFLNFIEKPKHIPNLWNHIKMTASNRWNEFIYKYDPLESPDLDRKTQITCLSQLISILFITVVTVLNDFIKGYKNTKNHLKYKMKFLKNLCKREVVKRNLSLEAVVDSIVFSLNPINFTKNFFMLFWWLSIAIIVLLPYCFCKEILALVSTLSGKVTYTDTLVGVLYIYTPLIFCALKEFSGILMEIIKAPRYIFEELFEQRTNESSVLQVKSYCGRKVASFSNSIDMETIKTQFHTDDIGETEFTFACLSGALYEFFKGFRDYPVPAMVNVTSISIAKDYFLEKSNYIEHVGGIVFLQLPLQMPNLQQIKTIQNMIERIRKNQIAIYMLGLAQMKFDILTNLLPVVWSKVWINYFSFNFPITITEISGDSSTFKTICGQDVEDLLMFRPPQSKTCLSISIHRFGRRSRLAVMADSQLAPSHNVISQTWEKFMQTVEI